MSNTMMIPKSKNMLYKKLSFLYLVFILFLFLTSPGEYVFQYPGIAQTQLVLNERLTKKLESYTPFSHVQEDLILATKDYLFEVDHMFSAFELYSMEYNLKGYTLKEKDFSDELIQNERFNEQLSEIVVNYRDAFKLASGKDISSELIYFNPSFSSTTMDVVDYFFKEVPNGAIESIFQHLKLVALNNTISYLDSVQGRFVAEKQLKLIQDEEFISKFRRQFILGEKLELDLTSKKPNFTPEVRINKQEVQLIKVDSIHYKLSYLPVEVGPYSIAINLDGNETMGSFMVKKPMLRFLTSGVSSLQTIVGEAVQLGLDPSFVKSLAELNFISNDADISRNGSNLSITSKTEGFFTVYMTKDQDTIDQVDLYARQNQREEVKLTALDGSSTKSIKNAGKLEAVSPFWDVLSYDLTIIGSDLPTQTYQSNSKHIRNDFLELIDQSEYSTATILFTDIVLISSDGLNKAIANPIVINQ